MLGTRRNLNKIPNHKNQKIKRKTQTSIPGRNEIWVLEFIWNLRFGIYLDLGSCALRFHQIALLNKGFAALPSLLRRCKSNALQILRKKCRPLSVTCNSFSSHIIS
jgi:hypothetical protein